MVVDMLAHGVAVDTAAAHTAVVAGVAVLKFDLDSDLVDDPLLHSSYF